MSGGPVGIGVIGAGNISEQYLDNLTRFPDLRVLAVGDLNPEAARSRAEQHGIPAHGSPEAVLTNPEVEIVVNLTIPAAHADVDLAAIAAGKHVWSEKPLTLDIAAGREVLERAAAAGVRIGCAPDTFLGAGLQSARRAIERGEIGAPLTALTLFQVPGPESWHPNPAFLYQRGGGPLFDMGPYYLTTLVEAFGSIARVAAVGSRAVDERTVGQGPLAGDRFAVEVPTHVSLLAQFEGGGSATAILSFEAQRPRAGFVEITGLDGVLRLPDPNRFDGDLRLFRAGDEDWESLPSTGPANGRGMGVLDMARSIRAGVAHRASGELALHVLEVMAAVDESARTGEFVTLTSRAPRTEPLPEDWAPTASTL